MNVSARTLLLALIGSSAGVLITHFSLTQWLAPSELRYPILQETAAIQAPQPVEPMIAPAAQALPAASVPLPSAASTQVPAPAAMPPTVASTQPKIYGGSGPSRVMLRATGDSWVQVRDADGELLFARVLRPGDIYRVADAPGLSLVTGNAGGLIAVVDGAERSLGQVGQVMRNVSLSPQTLGQIVSDPPTLVPATAPVASGGARTPTFQDLLSSQSSCRTWNAAPWEARWRFVENAVRQVGNPVGRNASSIAPYLEGCLRKLFEEPCVTATMSVPDGAATCVAMASRLQ